MKNLLSSTTIVSLALMPIAPMPSMAQVLDDTGRILATDGTVLCEPAAEIPCDPLNDVVVKAARAIDARLAAEAAQAAADAAKAAAAAAQAVAAAAGEGDAEAAKTAAAAAEAEAASLQAAADAAIAAAGSAQAEADAAKAAADAAAQAEADAAKAAADAAAQAEADAAKAAADAAAQAEADAAKAAADAAAQAEADAAKAAADAAAQAEADAAKAAADAAAQAEADAAKAAADAAAQAEADAAKAAADAAAQAEADAAKAAADSAAQAEADAAKAASDAAAQAEADAAKAAADAAAQAEADAAKAAADGAAQAEADAAKAAADAAAQAEADAAKTAADAAAQVDAAAGLAVAETPIDPDAPLVDAPVVSSEEVQALTDLLAAPASAEAPTAAPEVAAPVEPPPPILVSTTSAPLDPAAAEAALAAIPAAENTVATTVETIAPEAVRSSAQEFSAPPQVVEEGKKTGLSNLEKVGLFVLGALVIGQVIKSAQNNKDAGQTVVSNTGDRVVVQNPDGSYGLFKDDDAILRQAGSTVRTETYNDGSSRTIVQRADGTQVVTVRDATGRVLRRAQYDRLGRELVLLDDFTPEQPVNVADLPAPRSTLSTRSEDAALRAALAARQIERLGRSFSLRQIREIAQVRALAAEVDVERVTFASGSSAISPQQANALADLGAVMQDMLDANPAEMFLIEGHTDATGGAAMNLALSDRRAESVALALTEYFAIPPENMVVQGYGETELRVPTLAAEELNRRVAVRIITPLLSRAQ